jgi:hypothetical protein
MFGRVRSIALHGDSSPSLAGKAVNACLILARTDLNSLKGMPLVLHSLVHIQLWSMMSSWLRFTDSNHSVFSIPSKSNPKIVFIIDISPSPFISFLSDIGLSALLSSAGNML